MTVFQFITGHYNGERHSIDVWCRRHDNKEKELLSIMGFEPYMYTAPDEVIPTDEWVVDTIPGFDFFDGTKVKKVVVTDPLKVRDHRDDFSVAHEAKIRFVQRFLLDTKIRSSFETSIRGGVIPYTHLSPVDKVLKPLVVYMDIEVRTRVRFPNWRYPTDPVIAVSFYDGKYKKYITIIYDPDNPSKQHVSDNWIVIRTASIKEIIELSCGYLERIRDELLVGWNIPFDINYFNAFASKNFGLSLPLDGYEIFDLGDAYRNARPSLGNRLKEVVVREGIAKEEDMPMTSFDITYYENPRTRNIFIKYSKKDVEYCVLLDTGFVDVKTGKWKNYDLINRYWGEKNFAGLDEIKGTLKHAPRHDVFWLRKAGELGMVLPSIPDTRGESGIDRGAVVFDAREGLIPDSTVIDLSRYYPNILRLFPEVSPDARGLLAKAVVEELGSERDYWDAELLKCTPGTPEHEVTKSSLTRAKNFLSGTWGFFAYSGSRVYDPKKASRVLEIGREGMEVIKEIAGYRGSDVFYGDTDSVFLQCAADDVRELVDDVNDALTVWAADMGVAPEFKVKEDRYAENTLFIKVKGRDEAAKKRYAQLIIRETWQPCNYIMIKGFDFARGNTSEVTRPLQKDVIEAALRGSVDGLTEHVGDVVKKVRRGEYDIDDITIPVNLGKNIETTTHGEYYSGARYNIKYIKEEIVPGDMVRYFKAKSMPPGYPFPKGGWISYIDKFNLPKGIEVDYDWVVERTIRSPTERVLSAVGIQWLQVLGGKDARSEFR